MCVSKFSFSSSDKSNVSHFFTQTLNELQNQNVKTLFHHSEHDGNVSFHYLTTLSSRFLDQIVNDVMFKVTKVLFFYSPLLKVNIINEDDSRTIIRKSNSYF